MNIVVQKLQCYAWEGRQHIINLEMSIWLYSTVHVLHLMAMIEDS